MARYTKSQAKLISIGGCLVIFAAGMGAGAFPLFDSGNQKADQTTVVQQEADSLEIRVAALEVKTDKIDEQRKKLAALQNAHPTESEQEDQVQTILASASQNGLIVTSVSYGRPSAQLVSTSYNALTAKKKNTKVNPKTVPLVAVPISISVLGPRESVSAFIDQLGSSSRNIMIDKLSMSQAEGGSYSASIAMRNFVSRDIEDPLDGSKNLPESEQAPEPVTPAPEPVPAPEAPAEDGGEVVEDDAPEPDSNEAEEDAERDVAADAPPLPEADAANAEEN